MQRKIEKGRVSEKLKTSPGGYPPGLARAWRGKNCSDWSAGRRAVGKRHAVLGDSQKGAG
jgi:hypothetical protein